MTASDRSARPAVAVVIVSYEHGPYVAEAIDAAVGQTYPSTSVTIVDDASRDDTADRIRSHLDRTDAPVRFIAHDRNIGLCATLNEALAEVDADYVAIVAADDVMDLDRIERQVDLLERLGPEYGVAYADARRIDADGTVLDGTFLEQHGDLPDHMEGDLFLDLLPRNWIPAPTALIRTSVLREVGPYDVELSYEDHDMWLRIARHHRFAFLDEVVASYRVLPGSLSEQIFTEDPTRIQRSLLRIYRKHLGASAEGDAYLVGRMATLAIRLYREGVDPAELRGHLAVVARRERSLAVGLYAVAAALRIPGTWIRDARSIVRRHPVDVRHGHVER